MPMRNLRIGIVWCCPKFPVFVFDIHYSILRIRNAVHLKQQTLFAALMGEFGWNGFSDRVFPVESFLNHFLHDRNIPDITEQTIHLNDVFQRQPFRFEPLLHVIKSAVDLFLYSALFFAVTFLCGIAFVILNVN